jgi:hypothetical protein
MSYAVEGSLDLKGKATYEFALTDLYTRDVNTLQLVTRLSSHFRNIPKAILPAVLPLPKLEFHRGLQHFILTLPPRTAIFSDDPNFFPSALGFLPEKRMLPGARPEDAETRVYGIFNMEESDKLDLISSNMAENQPINERLEKGLVEPPKTTTRVYVAISEVHKFSVVGAESPLTPAGAAASLGEALTRGIDGIGLAANFVEVRAEGDHVVLTAQPIAQGSPLVLSLSFEGETAQYLNRQAEMQFPVASLSRYELSPDRYGGDPFEPHYPLNILSDEHGNSSCHVDQIGRVPSLAFVADSHSVVSSDIRFMAGDTQMTARFLDKYLEPVKFRLETRIYLTFQLNPST